MISFTPFFSLYQPLILPIYVHSDVFDTPEPVDAFYIFFSDLTIFPLEIAAEFCYFNAVTLRHNLHTPMQYSIISPFWQPVNDGNALFFIRFPAQVGHIAKLGFFSAFFTKPLSPVVSIAKSLFLC